MEAQSYELMRLLGVDLLSSCELKTVELEKPNNGIRTQCTLDKTVSIKGVGLFSGLLVSITFIPAPLNTGVVFRRVDLPGAPIIPANAFHVVSTPRCTILGKDQIVIQSVEHVLSALKAFNIDNVMIELDGPEVPIFDGSSLAFATVFEEAGVIDQSECIAPYCVKSPIYLAEGNALIVALPSKEMRFSYTLSYPGHPLLQAQFHTFVMDDKRYVEDIAPCRTFSLYEEILPLLEKGFIKGGTLQNGVVIKGNEVLNSEGLRFNDEMVRHKILDLIGDISLTGFPILAHIVAIRSGHYMNTQLAKMIIEAAKKEEEYDR